MEFTQQLARIADRLRTDTVDLRHTLLDVSEDFLAAAAEPDRFPVHLRDEVRAIRDALQPLQPQFPSHRKTSVLFDREGLGQKGRQRAAALSLRITAVCDVVVRSLEQDE